MPLMAAIVSLGCLSFRKKPAAVAVGWADRVSGVCRNRYKSRIRYNPPLMHRPIEFIAIILLGLGFAAAQESARSAPDSDATHFGGTPAQSELLWQRLDATVQQMNRELNGTMGVAVMDLTNGRTLLLNPDAVYLAIVRNENPSGGHHEEGFRPRSMRSP